MARGEQYGVFEAQRLHHDDDQPDAEAESGGRPLGAGGTLLAAFLVIGLAATITGFASGAVGAGGVGGVAAWQQTQVGAKLGLGGESVQLPKANETCAAAGLGWGRRFKVCVEPLGDSGVAGEVSIIVCLGGPGTAIGHGIVVGLEPDVGAAECTAPNACGVHLHAGYSCANATAQGGHLWMNHELADPWAEVSYESDADGRAEFDFTVPGVRMLDGMPGGEPEAMLGKTFIVHDTTGGRVACGLVVSD